MNFALRAPCKTCPFVKNGVPGYNPVRHLSRTAKRIATQMASPDGRSFSCHMTVDYRNDEYETLTDTTQHCAGALLFMEKVNPGGTQCVRIAERLHLYKRDEYRGAELVFDSAKAMVAANRERKGFNE